MDYGAPLFFLGISEATWIMSGYHHPRYVSDACADWWKRPRGTFDGSLEQGPRLGVRKRRGRFDGSLERGSSLRVRKYDQDGQRSSKERCSQVQRIPRERPQLGSSEERTDRPEIHEETVWPTRRSIRMARIEGVFRACAVRGAVSRTPLLNSSEW